MEEAHQSEASRHKNYRLKQHNHVANLHDYCAERDAIVMFQKNMILKLRRKNKRLRRQNDRQRKLVAKRKAQEEKDRLPQKEKESALHAALVKDDINRGVANNELQPPQPASVSGPIEDRKDKEIEIDSSMGNLERLERTVDLATHSFPEEVFQDPDNSDDIQQCWIKMIQEDTMSPNLQLNLDSNEDETQFNGMLSPMGAYPLTDEEEDLFDGRLN